LYPLSQFDLPIEQKVLDFKTTDEKPAKVSDEQKNPFDEAIADMDMKTKKSGLNAHDAVDFTVCRFPRAHITY
jgi:translation initiation factor eIF-2B subunit alpha